MVCNDFGVGRRGAGTSYRCSCGEGAERAAASDEQRAGDLGRARATSDT